MSLQEFRDLLLTVTEQVYHFENCQDTEEEYIIWQETGGKSTHASNERSETVKQIQVELYTSIEFTNTIDAILNVLETNDIAFQEPTVHFDKDTKKIRYIIECEVL